MANARLRELREKQKQAWAEVQDMQDRRAKAGYDNAKEDEASYVRAMDDLEQISNDIETEERAERLLAASRQIGEEGRSTNPRPGSGEGNQEDPAKRYGQAFTNYVRRGMLGLDQEDRQLIERGLVAGEEFRALATTTGAAGGYTVPTEFLNRLSEVRKAFGGIAQYAETIRTSNGDPIQWATNDDTANIGAILTENTAVTEQDTTFGSTTLGAFMYTSKLVRVSFQLLQDSMYDIDALLARKLGERIGRAFAAHVATGTGTGQPQGITVGLTLSVTGATSGEVNYDDLIDLEHTIDPAYRTDRARYVVHDSVIRALRKKKDSQGRPLWAPAITDGAPATINGKPYTVDNSLPTLATGSKSVVFGDIGAAYVVREVAGAQTLRLDERYAEYLQRGFLGFQRLDGKVQDTQAAAVLVTKA